MKKILLALAALLTLTIFSCASDSAENSQDNIDEITSPEVSEETAADSENLLSKKLPEPEDFEEPVVRDLDISEIEPVLEESIPATVLSEAEKSIVPETQAVTPLTKEPVAATTESADLTQKNQTPAAENKAETKTETVKTEEKQNTAKTAENTKVGLADTKKETANQNTKKTETNTAAKNDTKSADQTKNNTIKTEPEEEQIQQPLTEKEPVQIIPSRKVTVNTNETLTVTYPGYGWIYLGSESENNNLVSTGRKVENEETVYTLTAKNPGTQLQHFYKVDTITGNFIDDYIEVEVLDNKGSVYTVVKAPDYAEVVPERPESPAVASTKRALTAEELEQKEVKPTEKRNYEVYTPETETVNKAEEVKSIYKSSPDSYTENLNADDLLAKAQSLFNQEKYVESQKYLNNFMAIATEKRDEGLYLQGQIFEQDGATKNIKESISSYTTLTESYPESIYWDDAKKRIIYLNRFYIQIR